MGPTLFFCPPLSVLTVTRHPLIHPIHGGGYSPASLLDQAIVESIPILFELNLGGGFKMGIDCYYNILKVHGTSCRITEAVPPRTLLSSAFCPGVSLRGYFTLNLVHRFPFISGYLGAERNFLGPNLTCSMPCLQSETVMFMDMLTLTNIPVTGM